MLPEFDHFKILEQKCFGQGIVTETETMALWTALKPNRTTAFLTSLILDRNP